ncbi:MAG: nickel pincer cofactor biosynthesis protein LarC [Polyangiaceae bacterium]
MPNHTRLHGHDHAHDHDHGHDHDHDHHHHDAAPASVRSALTRGAGNGCVVFLDAPSGLAGDMIVAALVDLGVPFDVISDAVSRLPLQGVRASIDSGHAGAIGARRFDVHVEGTQPERQYREIDTMLAAAPLPHGAQTLARAIFRRLAEAEAEVHRVAVDDVHFHEVGAVDAIVDIVGAATAFDYIGGEVIVSPLPLGHGHVTCRHGVIPLPAPAALLCLRDVPTYDAGIEAELVTPTGAAIVATVAQSFSRWPSISATRVGWGMGTQTLPDRPNALRAVLGRRWAAAGSEVSTHIVLEANIDDMSGELAGHALTRLLAAGALDAWITPILMKKGRPGITIAALCLAARADEIGAVLLRETSPVGYRTRGVTRGERPRRFVAIETPYGSVPVKISEGPWGQPQMKPEFDVCVERAEQHGVTVREVIQAALRAAQAEFEEEAH